MNYPMRYGCFPLLISTLLGSLTTQYQSVSIVEKPSQPVKSLAAKPTKPKKATK